MVDWSVFSRAAKMLFPLSPYDGSTFLIGKGFLPPNPRIRRVLMIAFSPFEVVLCTLLRGTLDLCRIPF